MLHSVGYNTVMKNARQPLWSIDELGVEVWCALSTGYAGAASGRVRDVPDLRTIRYYTTLGLIDRPAEMRGRTALYSRRHLLQLVAIKRLQARGLSLAQVQEQLLGASDVMLGRLANEAADSGGKAPGEGEVPKGKAAGGFILEIQAGRVPGASGDSETRRNRSSQS